MQLPSDSSGRTLSSEPLERIRKNVELGELMFPVGSIRLPKLRSSFNSASKHLRKSFQPACALETGPNGAPICFLMNSTKFIEWIKLS